MGEMGRRPLTQTHIKRMMCVCRGDDRNLLKKKDSYFIQQMIKQHISTTINMALYLEQDLKLAQETECWKGCSLWATGKWHMRVLGGSMCYQMWTAVARRTLSDRGGRWVFEACGCFVHPYAGSAGCGFCIYLEFLARETMQKQTQNSCCTQTFPWSWSCWNKFSSSIQALWQIIKIVLI